MPDVQALDRAAHRRAAGATATTTRRTRPSAACSSHLLLYHHREGKPEWWRYFDLRGMPLADLLDERDAIAGLVRDADASRRRRTSGRSTTPSRFRRRSSGSTSATPRTRRPASPTSVVASRRRPHRPAPRQRRSRRPPRRRSSAARPIDVGVLREALDGARRGGARRRRPLRGGRAPMLRREPPRSPRARSARTSTRWSPPTLGLDRSILPVQGPPGHRQDLPRRPHDRRGAAPRAGASAITAPSHAAIQNLLARRRGVRARAGRDVRRHLQGRGLRRARTASSSDVDDNDDVDGRAPARRRHGRGCSPRPSTASASTCSSSTRPASSRSRTPSRSGRRASSVVLLGDPQQLPQVTQADHPGGSGASVLEHLLDGASTIPPDRGVLLDRELADAPRRLRVRLRAQLRRPAALARGLRERVASTRRPARSAAPGCASLAVEHEGRSQASPEEAEAIAAACRDLLAGATVTDDEGRDAAARRRRHPRRRALQPRRPLHPRARPRRRARRHRRPLPGPAGRRSSSTR